MSVLDYVAKDQPELFAKDKERAVFNYVVSKDSELEGEVSDRLYGMKNKTGTGYRRAGYQILRDFYEGDQWTYTREEGSSMNVVNYCRVAVDNFTAFMTQEQPEIDIPPRDPKDDVETARVTEVEKLIADIFDDNDWFNDYQEAVQNGSLLGDTFIAGPFYDAQKKRIWWTNVKKPEFVRIIWKDENYKEIIGYIFHYFLSVEDAQSRFGDLIAKRGLTLQSIVAADGTMLPQQKTEATQGRLAKRVLVREFWDEKIRTISLNDQPLEYNEHNFGYVPCIYIKNHPHPTESWGQSDIEDLLDAQKSYNELDSDMQDILKQVAFASIFGKNLSVSEIQSGVAKIYDMGEESEVFPDPRHTNYPFLQGFLGDKKRNVDSTSRLPELFTGGTASKGMSGRALSVMMTPINNRIHGKERRWTVGLKQLVRNIEILIEKFVPGGRDLIQGYYKCDVFFPGTLIRETTEELNKFMQKLQSQYTTMKNLGIASPKDEQQLMKKELSDSKLMIEISKNPQLQMMLAQQLIQQAQQKAAERNKAAGNAPTLTEGQNQPGQQPASTAGNPTATTVPMGGAPAMAASAAGNPPMIMSK